MHEGGFRDEVVAGGLLHDVVEDTAVEPGALRRRFGAEIGALVEAMTEPADVQPYEARKSALREQVAGSGEDAEAIFAADKIVNASSLRAAIAKHGQAAVEQELSNPIDKKIEHYEASLELLERVAEGLAMLPRLRRELRRLQIERARDEGSRLARTAAEALNSGDADRLIEITAPDVEWHPALTFGRAGGAYRGHAGIRAYVDDLHSLWRGLRTDVHDVRRHGDQVIAICDIRAEGRVSRRAIAQQSAIVYWIKDGKVACARTYLDASEPAERAVVAVGGSSRE